MSQQSQPTPSPIGRVVRAARRRRLRVASADTFTFDALQRRLIRRENNCTANGNDSGNSNDNEGRRQSPRRKIRVRQNLLSQSSDTSGRPPRAPPPPPPPPPSSPLPTPRQRPLTSPRSVTNSHYSAKSSSALPEQSAHISTQSHSQLSDRNECELEEEPTSAHAAARLTRRRSDTRQTLLSFPEHDAATVSTLLAHFRGDRARVIATLREARRQAGINPKSDAKTVALAADHIAENLALAKNKVKSFDFSSNGEGGANTNIDVEEDDEEEYDDANDGSEHIKDEHQELSAALSGSEAPLYEPSAASATIRPRPRRFSTDARASFWDRSTRKSPTSPNSSSASVTRITGAKRPRMPHNSPSVILPSLSPSVGSSNVKPSSYERTDRTSVTSSSESWRGDARGEVSSRSTATTTTSAAGFGTPEDDVSTRDGRDSTSFHTNPGAESMDYYEENSTVKHLLLRVAELEQRLKKYDTDALRAREHVRHRMDSAERKMSALDSKHDALGAELDENQRRVVKTEQYLDSMRRDMVLAVGRRRSRFIRAIRVAAHNVLYYLLAYLVPVFAFIVCVVRDVIVNLRSRRRNAPRVDGA